MKKLRPIFICLVLVISLTTSSGCFVSQKVSQSDVENTPTVAVRPSSRTISPEEAAAELEAKLKESPPQRDLFSLSERLKGKLPGADARLVNAGRPDYEIGTKQTFWLSDQQKKNYYTISATLRYKTPHAYLFVQDGQDVPAERLKLSGDVFENQIFRSLRGYFGIGPDAGVGNDIRVTILHASFPGPPGYYSSADEYPKSINPYSNEREMIYINLRNNNPASERYYATIAHEFQHMIHWRWDTGEDTWVNEGLSELAVRLAGFAPSSSVTSFAPNPDVQLNAWGSDPQSAVPHYGAAYLFLSYLTEHYGGYGEIKDLVSEKTRGINGIERYLAKKNYKVTFDDVFKDWVIANYLDDRGLDNGRYGYRDVDVHVSARGVNVGNSPVYNKGTVHQYAAQYLDLGQIRGDYAITFTGTTTVKLLANDPHSGMREWWSNRGDGMDTTLTHEFDLSNMNKATLLFSAWYDVEKDFDYAYAEASTDGGTTWKTLQGQYTTDNNPNGTSFGSGFTGKSGGGTAPDWVKESIDLSPYAGKKLLIRFEYVTDDAYSGPGFAVDDISVPELGYKYDVETGGGWNPNGFVLSGNSVPQRYFVQVIKSGPQAAVESLPINDNRQGQLVVHGDGATRFVLVVAAAAPGTLELANYEYSVEPLSSGQGN